MKYLKNLSLLAIIALMISCAGSSNEASVDYYSKSGLLAPKFSNNELNKHLDSFKPLFNELGTAAVSKDKEKSNDLSKAYSDWLLKSLDFKGSLSEDEQKQLNTYLESTNTPWNKFKNELF